MALPNLPIEIRMSILGNLGPSDLRAALLSGPAFHDAFQEAPRSITRSAALNDISPAARRDAVAFLIASGVHGDPMALGDHRREELARHMAAASEGSPATRADEQWYLMEALQLSNLDPAMAWPDRATSTRILHDYWLFASCPGTLVLSDDELKGLAKIHAAAEPLMADFFMRATSSNLPDSLHARPQLLPAKEARKIMAQLSPEERARIHRTFYRRELLNCLFTAARAPPLGQLVANALKAWCLSATWQPWEVQEVLTLHAYFRHQHELILETVCSAFIHRLEAMATPDCPKATVDWLRTGANPPPPYANCIGVNWRNNINEPQIHVYIEQQANRGAANLTRFLAQNNLRRRTLVRGNYHALVWPLGFDTWATHERWTTQIKNLSLFSCGDTVTRAAWDRNGGFFHPPSPGGFVYEHSLLTGLVFWDLGRPKDLQRRVRGSIGEGPATWLGFRRPDEGPRPEGSGVGWWFTQLPQSVPVVDGAKLEELKAEFGCLCDEAEHVG